MEIRKLFLTGNDCYKANQLLEPAGIMVHDTGADNPNLRRYVGPDDGVLGENPYGNHWNRPGVGACVHAFIGKDKNGQVRVYQTLPWDVRSWHCGRSGNNTHLSFEICQDSMKDETYFRQTVAKAVELCVYLCRKFGLDPLAPGVLISHAEGYKLGIASGHNDTDNWWAAFGYTMDDFRREVALAMEEEQIPAWAKPTVDKLLEKGVLKGTGKGLGLTEDLLRVLVLLDRLGNLSVKSE